jgi:hypothetical protein
MRRHVIAIAVGGTAVALTSNSSLAQRTPRPRTVDPTQSKLLDAEKQAQVKAFVRDYDRIVKDGPKLPRVDQTLAVGELVPEDVALAVLPQNSVTEVPFCPCRERCNCRGRSGHTAGRPDDPAVNRAEHAVARS